VEAGGLEHCTYVARRVGEFCVGAAVDRCRAFGRGDQTEQHPQGRGLAGAVGAQEAGHGPFAGAEAEVVDGRDLAEAFR
jgi:hypothetical protein